MSKIACITTLKTLPDKRDELIRHCKAYAARFVEQEPGTLRIELLLPPTDQDAIIIWDVYENFEAVEAHRNGELLRKFGEETKSLLLSMSGVRHTMLE
jgi:quinol monooxygenase YgiN